MQARQAVKIGLETQLESLPIILDGFSKEALDRRPIPDKWSARENLAHLARYNVMFLERIRRIRSEDGPLVTPYRAEQDPEWPQWAAKSTDVLLEQLRASRANIVATFETLSEAELMRTASHSRFGEMTLLEWMEFFLLHEAHHLFTMMQRVRESR
jgi:uncharacterized damage-inducible protein DinB